MRANISVGLSYLASWLAGNGAAAINNLMEDAATAEISRSQLWQWRTHGVRLEDGQPLTADRYAAIRDEELEKIRAEVGDEFFHSQGRPQESRDLFEDVALSDRFVDFLTLPAYERLDD